MKKIDIVYEDKELLIVNKPAKLLTVATSKHEENTLFRMTCEYVKKKHPKNKVFIVNRLDKDTSGIVVFAKNEALKKYLQDNWDKVAINREYYAIVCGVVKKKKDTLKSFLLTDNFLNVYSSKDSKKGKLAITNYEVVKTSTAYSLLKINILTGRRNQIRVQLSDMGHPIIGDKKYGAKKNPIGMLGLVHAKLELNYQNKNYVFEVKIPKEMQSMF